MNRKDKIKILQRLENGESVNELLPLKFLINVSADGPTKFFINGKSIDEGLFSQLFRSLPKPIKFKVIDE